jgi:hypothetical protein
MGPFLFYSVHGSRWRGTGGESRDKNDGTVLLQIRYDLIDIILWLRET